MWKIMKHGFGPEPQGEYLHWDKLRHLQPPDGFTVEEWWLGTMIARSGLQKELPLLDKAGIQLHYVPTEGLYRRLHLIDQQASGAIGASDFDLLNPETRDRYLVNSLFEEAITSSQLEGAATTRKVAKEMLRTGRKPLNKSEQMIVNNYRAMLFIRDCKTQPLSLEMIQELHRILCDKTLDDPSALGRWRSNSDNVCVYDNRDGTTLHVPPNANELDDRIAHLCNFANSTDGVNAPFFHPVVRGILLHFMLGYDHPFIDGNGRTARALFYWFLSRHGYWLIEFISISNILNQKPSQYARAYLYTESDNNDVTYFLIHQAEVILEAIQQLNKYVGKKAAEQRRVDRFLRDAGHALLNHRQTALIAHAIRHPDTQYTIQSHRRSHAITYQTARTDLLALANMGLLIQSVRGNRYVFHVPVDLETILQRLSGETKKI